MSELPLKEAIEILTQEKKKVELKLVKAYDSFCLYPNEADQNDWDRFSALDSAFEMAISALKRQESAIRMLNDEERNGRAWHSKEYSNGRISAFYDALGMNYAD